MQRSLRASSPTMCLTVRVASCLALTVLTVSGCSQIVDFDRSKIPAGKDAGERPDGNGDSGVKDGGRKDSGMTMTEAGTDSGPAAACDVATHEGCMPNELCCADTAGVLRCVATSVAQCEGCGMACNSAVANDCTERTCGCGWMSKVECSAATPKCDAAQGKCVECTVSADCSANASNKFCFAPGATANAKDNTCVACDRATHDGCSGKMPICDATATCVACNPSPNNCGGTLVCLSNGPSAGACQCSGSGDCTTPTTPICDGGSKLCVGCTTDPQCSAKMGGTVCVTGGGSGSLVGECAACDPQDDGGCSGTNNQCKPGATPVCVDCLADSDCTGATPLCNLTNNTCVACDAIADADARCAAKSGTTDTCATSGTKIHECAACDPTDDGGCSDNLPACTVASVCVQCTGTKLAKCNDGSLCTTDACNGSNVCTNTAVSTSDGISCTTDSCVADTGVAHAPNNNACEVDTFSCTVPACSLTTGCSETANDGLCADTVGCTVDDCVGAGGNANGCKNTPTNAMCPNTDGRSCSVPTCSATTGCSEVLTNSLCNDSVACTTDACAGASGDTQGCTFTPVNSACPSVDAFSCTVPTCNPVSGCSEVPDNSVCASLDAFSCTVPTCNTVSGCSEVPDNTSCDDGLPATTDTCNPAMGLPVTGCLSTP